MFFNTPTWFGRSSFYCSAGKRDMARGWGKGFLAGKFPTMVSGYEPLDLIWLDGKDFLSVVEIYELGRVVG